ncbi:hypothetical protein JOD31_002947 [Methylopila capsulata]|uniref:Uncharacterized protein n=1 Tax=Methylopila capsulata TaxID=61654 RepID=A0A9W6IWL0_9HYPH|nr:hypothetical protein [Methylopila capsulata]MBM7852705.1 hypothetical protein [Methylopila capsulata]GLK56914.1 hypothetical protein GCM10008170_29330 [Methylopila capsulata]
MKNIQIIDGAQNCTFSIFQATDEEFALIFPGPGQDIEFAEDLWKRIRKKQPQALDGLAERPILKTEANGIHGTLFYGFEAKRKHFPKTKRERDWNPLSINTAQRRLYGQEV